MTACTCDTFNSATSSPAITASNTAFGNAIRAVNTYTGAGETAYLSCAGTSATLHVEGSGTATEVVYVHSSNGSVPYCIMAEGAVTGVLGKSYVNSGNGVLGQCNPLSAGYPGNGVYGQDLGGSTLAGIGVLGASNYGTGVYGNGYGIGVYGQNNSATGIGVSAYGNGTNAFGLYASGSNTGISGVAAAVNGNLHVSGSILKGGGGFRIDHPQDPENKYLIHSFVEAPKATNIHRGETVLDAKGNATVKLPAYWESANENGLVNLTAVGCAMPGLFASRIVNGTFNIQGGAASQTVNWVVMSDRSDVWAKTYDPGVEVEKSNDKKGLFLNPELHGKTNEHHEFAPAREAFAKNKGV